MKQYIYCDTNMNDIGTSSVDTQAKYARIASEFHYCFSTQITNGTFYNITYAL